MKAIAAIFVSVWDGGVEVRTDCQYNPETKEVWDIETSDVNGLENLEDEYVELPDGTEVRDYIDVDNGNDAESLSDEDIEAIKKIFNK